MEVKCIIFDCDGVLVDTEKIGNEILLSMAAEHGFEMKIEDAYSNFNGRNLKECFLHVENSIGKKLPDNFESEYRERSFEAFETQVKPMEGVVAFIEKLKISYCVASSGPVEKIRLNLEVAGLLDKFEGKIFSAYQIDSWKPDPGIFLFAAKQMGFDVKDCIVVEDSKAGVKAGISGGFKVYGFANGFNNEDLEKEGATLFNSYEELKELLKF
ncbi:haloacid dehalogenase superfamily, subfamily IA, variant 3 with third motif having DD or ED [Flavobacterium aquidurense]|uniref:Haloacid dehalogenase n=1 Tax=Flavobacterium frigidimaris TaxID=262320 RepID=A0ABX4BKR6_FLAFR|nr:HAD family hydrolase [Flavobacterium frigidimaris]OXA76446.1 haloacid dehalogenase [Flavobacterium frigidimaris]SDZ64720.1 haloacid dehalogenase superfamily, subfamily IA, variant 3 with third motif having DD or ED [Flavobacterium aquidurense]